MLVVLHAIWGPDGPSLWGESLRSYLLLPDGAQAGNGATVEVEANGASGGGVAIAAPPHLEAAHPFAIGADELRTLLRGTGLGWTNHLGAEQRHRLQLPRDLLGPLPSDRLASAVGGIDRGDDPGLGAFDVESLAVGAGHLLPTLLALDSAEARGGVEIGDSVRYWSTVARFALELLAAQRFIPSLQQERDGAIRASWRLWTHDEGTRIAYAALLGAMPPVVRARCDDAGRAPWEILERAIAHIADRTVRTELIRDDFIDSIDGWDAHDDMHVAWLSGLLSTEDAVPLEAERCPAMFSNARHWIARLDDTGRDQSYRLCLELQEPPPPGDEDGVITGGDANWTLILQLQSNEDPLERIDAESIWGQDGDIIHIGSDDGPEAQELLLAEIGRAARLYPKLEEVLADATPSAIELSTQEAWTFMHEYRPLLEESGIGVVPPTWWGGESSRLGVRLQLDAGDFDEASGAGDGGRMLGLGSLVQYRWQIAVGDQPLLMEEFQRLVDAGVPLLRIRGRWVEVQPELAAAAHQFLGEHPGGEMTLMEAVRLAWGEGETEAGLPVTGIDASGWVADLLGSSADGEHRDDAFERIDQPTKFEGTLRPYQLIGLSWLVFLDRLGLGACLADDMGLGKTIQLIALLQHEREAAGAGVQFPPTLLVVPTSVIGNWVNEINRFAGELSVHVQHGPDRPTGETFQQLAASNDVIITTYALVTRDQEMLGRVPWHRVVLDEAQYIKNPPTKQTMAIRSLNVPRRIALTGTPVENRLTELWSIMDFCNPDYLGPSVDFRRRFARPIERHRDGRQAQQLRRLVQPFILRRLKTDRTVISDLPQCLETKEFATLTHEQVTLYQQVVDRMLSEVDRSDGIQRRGLILAMLGRLKQICNHPAQLSEHEELNRIVSPEGGDLHDLSARSGKARRLITLLEEVTATGERALVFTQYRRMGKLLSAMIEHDLHCNTLFLHGGTPSKRRQSMIDEFQSEKGDYPVFVLSLKAGGIGLNLTAANHVFHYDRWWNPAVENQATDRAFRIGQTRTVHVHKFVCMGTLEERIDQMIQQKTELAQNIIGAGDSWLTEMSTSQLHEVLTLRGSAMEAEG